MSDTVDNSISRKIKDIAAGFIGGATQVLIGQPADLVKVRLQTGQFNSSIEVIKTTLAQEGPLAFYKGTLAPLFGVGACVSIQFYGFHEARRQFLKRSNSKELSLGQFYLSGAFAGVVNTPITAPVEQLRILLQTQSATNKVYNGPRDALSKIYQGHGFSGIFRGGSITLAREFQAYGVWFFTYEYLMQRAIRSRNIERKDIGTPELLLYGAAAGDALWLSSYPLDVIKSRIQSDGFGAESRYKSSITQAIKVIYRADGIRGFWRGITPALVRAIPCSAGTFASVELALRLMG